MVGKHRNLSNASLHLYTHAFPNNNENCYYCNDIATCLDHVPPLSHASNYIGVDEIEFVLIPACRECNSLAANRLHLTKEIRREFLAKKIQYRHRKLLSLPHWQEYEIDELCRNLKTTVRKAMRKKEKVLKRLEWINRDSYLKPLNEPEPL